MFLVLVVLFGEWIALCLFAEKTEEEKKTKED